MEFDVPVETAGDVRARLLVRALEIMESCRILRQALAKNAAGEFNTETTERSLSSQTGTAVSRVEAPRGEVMYSVSWKENSRTPAGCMCARPRSQTCRPFAGWWLGARLADTP
jgi:Ni,Fe-hydrogenase III large subunit